MDAQYIVPIIVVVLIFGTKAFKEVKDYLLKREQIRTDALERTEAIRFKNQLELEKLIQKDQEYKAPQQEYRAPKQEYKVQQEYKAPQQENNEAEVDKDRQSNNRLRY